MRAIRLLGAIHARLVLHRRARILAEHLAALMPPRARILDVGCGDGLVDRSMMDLRSDLQIEGIDTVVRSATHIPVTWFDGDRVPFPDNSFDVVTFVDVLHHTHDAEALLAEAKRVARCNLVVKDHVLEGFLARPTLRIMDWVGNAPHGIALPYNYWCLREWQAAFTTLELVVDEWRSRIGLYPWPASLLFERRLHFVARLGWKAD